MRCAVRSALISAVTASQLPVAALSATDLFVKPAGSGAACSQASPCPLATALAAASTGDTVNLAAGTYAGTGHEVVLLASGVQLLGGWNGAPAGPVLRDPVAYESILDGESARRGVTVTAAAARIDGLTITHGNASGTGADCGGGLTAACGGGIFVQADDVTIANNRIVANTADAAAPGAWRIGLGGGVAAYYADGLSVTGNTIAGNTASTASAGAGGGVSLYGSHGAVIAGNRIVGNTATTQPGVAGWGGGVSLQGFGDAATVERNVLAGNVASPFNGWSSGNGLYTWYFAAEIRGNAVTCDNWQEAVYLGFFDGSFVGNRVFGGQDDEIVAIVNRKDADVTLANNILVAGGGTQRVIHVDGYDEHPVVATLLHNTIVGNGASVGVYVDEYGTANLSNNIVASNARGMETLDNGVINADHTLLSNNAENPVTGTDWFLGDPPFANRAAGDFRLPEGSAADGAGADAGVAADIDGEPRPGIDGIDLGADEVAPTRFDFGTPTSPVAEGWVQVVPETIYTAAQGYGWLSGSLAARDRGAETDVQRDFVFTKEATFAVDIANGRYLVWLTMGDRTASHSQMGVFLEGVQVPSVTTAVNAFHVQAYPVSVSDGQLTVLLKDLGGSDPNVVINGIRIVGDVAGRFDLGTSGSPVAPGFTRVTNASAWAPAAGFGWRGGVLQARDRGTADPRLRDLVFTPRGVFSAFVANGTWDVTVTLGDAAAAHDQMGVSVQGSPLVPITTAKNQFVSRTWRAAVADNRLDILLDDLGGGDPNVVVDAIEIARPPYPEFDFGTPASPVAPGYVQVTQLTRYGDGRGYGWVSGTVQSRDRGVGSDLQRDLCFSPSAELAVDLVSGTYDVTITLGDAAGRHDQMGVYLEEELVDTVSTGFAALATTTFPVTVRDGRLDVALVDQGGTDPNVTIVALEIH